MARYYEDENRKRWHESGLEHGNYVTIEELRDILELVKHGKWPDGTYSDFHCNVWSLIREYWPNKFD